MFQVYICNIAAKIESYATYVSSQLSIYGGKYEKCYKTENIE